MLKRGETCLLTASETMEPTDMSRRIFSDYAEQAARQLSHGKNAESQSGTDQARAYIQIQLILVT